MNELKLSAAEINKRIATLEGWTDIQFYTPPTDVWHELSGCPVVSFYRGHSPKHKELWSEIPDYANDPVIVRAAVENILTTYNLGLFGSLLCVELGCHEQDVSDAAFRILMASPIHIAKALLGTVGEWN